MLFLFSSFLTITNINNENSPKQKYYRNYLAFTRKYDSPKFSLIEFNPEVLKSDFEVDFGLDFESNI